MGAEAMARQSDALAHRTDRWSRVAEIACPTLCLWGVEDKFTPASEGRRLAAAVQRGRSEEIANCGHFPTLEYPEDTAAILKDWIHAALA
jgi:pimeloyl-ACP methyl ester carboxylesterase